jgi:hypothetical protein
MATGFERRGAAQSPFSAGVDLSQKVGLQGNVAVPGVDRPAGINVQPVNTDIMNGLAEWGGKAIQDQAAKQMNASLLDGQMAAAQGESFAQVETGGDRWKIEGFHQMEAQTMSAQLLEAQKAEISNSAYALSPDQYRAQFNTRVDAMLDGKDPRVQDLVRKQIAGQVPVLAGAQMGAYTNYAAQRTYEAGVQAVHAISQDSTGDAALAAIADPGPNSPLAALGPNERRSALTDGVLFAFQNDNPGAYIKMKAAGTFNDFTPEQQARIEAGRKDWMARMAAQFDPVRMEAFNDFNTKLDNAEFATPMEAVAAAKGMYDKFGLDFDNQQAWQVQTAALTGIGVAQQTTANNIETAAVSGDINAVADMIAPSMGKANDANFRTVFGSLVAINNGDWKKAIGDYLLQNPQGGIDASSEQWKAANLSAINVNGQEWQVNNAAKPAFEGFLNELAGMGYNLTSSGGYNYRHIDRDPSKPLSEHATGMSIDINAGELPLGMEGTGNLPPNISEIAAKYGLKWGGDFKGRKDPMHFEYIAGAAVTDAAAGGMTAESVIASLTGQPTGASRLAASETALTLARSERQVADYSQMAPQREQLDNAFINGGMSQADWQQQRGALYEKYHMQRTTSDVDTEIALTNEAAKNAASNVSQQAATEFGAKMADAEARMQATVSDPNVPLADKQAAIGAYAQERNNLMAGIGLKRNADQEFGFYRGLQNVWSEAVKAEETNGPKRVAVARAAETGTLGTDGSIDPKFRDKWYEGVLQTARDSVARAVAKEPKLTPQANAMAQSYVMDKLAKAGYIPEGMQARYTAAVEGNLVDRNGNPTPDAMSSIQDYMALSVKNPRVADMMFTPGSKALAIAKQIAYEAGNDPNGVQSAITSFNNRPPIVAGMKSAQELEAAPELQSVVADRVNSMVWQRHGAAWKRETIWSFLPDSVALQNEVQQVAAENWAKAGGAGDPTPHVKAAIEEVGARTSMVGGVMVTAPKGVNIVAETFGNADMSNDPHAVDQALRLFIKSHAGDKTYGIPPDVNIPWQDRPTEAEGLGGWMALPFVGAAKYATQAGAFLKTPFRTDAGAAGLYNFDADMVPHSIRTTPNGVVASVMLTDAENYGKMITVPLAEAGRAYTQWRKSTAINP